MIVKDEAHVIRRCLESVAPFVDGYVIADTGSTDGTAKIIAETLALKRGTIAHHPWVDFAHNRNRVLDLAREYFGEFRDGEPIYALHIDADEVLVHTGPAIINHGPDGYRLNVEYSGTRYQRLALTRLDRPWCWIGPVHEYLELEGASIGTLTAPSIKVYHEGARSQDPDTYRKDAALLEKALKDEPGNPRYQFYLGQSYRDAGLLEDAIDAYRVRADNPAGWADERWASLHQIARATEWQGWSAMVPECYLAAYGFDTSRAEPLVDLAEYERKRERYAVGALYARAALDIEPPREDRLFVDTSAYTWRAWDTLAVCAFYAGERQEALDAAIIAADYAPEDERLAENLRVIKENQ